MPDSRSRASWHRAATISTTIRIGSRRIGHRPHVDGRRDDGGPDHDFRQVRCCRRSRIQARCSSGWSSLYSDHSNLSNGITFLHLAGLIVGGGAAVTTDRQILKAWRAGGDRRRAVLDDVSAVHVFVVGGLVLTILTCAPMMLADSDTFSGSKLFWTKMAGVGVLSSMAPCSGGPSVSTTDIRESRMACVGHRLDHQSVFLADGARARDVAQVGGLSESKGRRVTRGRKAESKGRKVKESKGQRRRVNVQRSTSEGSKGSNVQASSC